MMKDESVFLEKPIDTCEVQKAVNQLHCKKSCGFDNVVRRTCEIWRPYADDCFDHLEYIPVNFRRGVQIPLFKGKKIMQFQYK